MILSVIKKCYRNWVTSGLQCLEALSLCASKNVAICVGIFDSGWNDIKIGYQYVE